MKNNNYYDMRSNKREVISFYTLIIVSNIGLFFLRKKRLNKRDMI